MAPGRIGLASLLLLVVPLESGVDLDLEGVLAERVDEERMVADVRALVALGPRMGGTRSGDRAVAYRIEQLEAVGLETRTLEAPPKWCHEEERFSVVAIVDGDELPLERAWPWGYSPTSAGQARVALEPADDVAVLASSPPRRRRGDDEEAPPSPAVVLVDGVTTPDGSWPAVRHGRRSAEVPTFGLSRDEGAALRTAIEAGSSVEVRWELEARIVEASPRTVEAVLPARDGAPPGYFLFCAHGDSDAGGPGANDNGSGEAIVLEIARVWASAVADGTVPPPAREVRFAWWGSEIYSTRDYLENHRPDGQPLLGVVNYDQAGFGTGAEQLNVEPDDLPANQPFVRLVHAVLSDHAGRHGLPARWATNKSLGGTDSYVFSRSDLFQEGGLPAVTLFTSAWDHADEHPRTEGMPGESWSDRDVVSIDFDNFYHSAGDLPENTTDREPWNMGWCARAGLLSVMRWLDALDAETDGAPERTDEPAVR